MTRILLPGFWLEPEYLSISHQSSGPYNGFQLHLELILKYFYSFINHSTALVAPVTTFLRPVAVIKFEMSSYSGLKCKLYPFKHLLCSLCSIVNIILAHVILKTFSFNFIQKKIISQHFQKLGCISIYLLRKGREAKIRCVHAFFLFFFLFFFLQYILTFTCTFSHFADAFIQSDLQLWNT